MEEGEGVGPKVKDPGGGVGMAAIEAVTEDGAAEAFRMGGVDAELVGAAGVGREADVEGSVGEDCEDLVFREGLFAVPTIDSLARPVVPVGGDGEVDPAVGSGTKGGEIPGRSRG